MGYCRPGKPDSTQQVELDSLLPKGDVLIGSTRAAPKISPLDLFPDADTGFKYDPDTLEQLPNAAVNMARLLQSLDCSDNRGNGAIEIESAVANCFSGVTGGVAVDFYDTDQVETLVEEAVATCDCADGRDLTAVTLEEAAANLERALEIFGTGPRFDPAARCQLQLRLTPSSWIRPNPLLNRSHPQKVARICGFRTRAPGHRPRALVSLRARKSARIRSMKSW